MVAFSAQALSSYLVCPSQLPKPHGHWPRPPRSPQAHVTWLAVGLRVSTGGPRDTAVAERYPHRPEIALTVVTTAREQQTPWSLWLGKRWPCGCVRCLGLLASSLPSATWAWCSSVSVLSQGAREGKCGGWKPSSRPLFLLFHVLWNRKSRSCHLSGSPWKKTHVSLLGDPVGWPSE